MFQTPYPGRMPPLPTVGPIPKDITNQTFPIRIGRAAELDRVNNRQSLLAPTGSPCGAETLNISLQASDIIFDPNPPPGTEYSAYLIANITFGIAGGRHSVEVDVKNGVQLSLLADSLSAEIQLLDVTNPGSPIKAMVSASLSHGSRAQRSFPTRTVPKFTVQAGTSESVLVPPFAYSVMLFSSFQSFYVPGVAFLLFSGTNGSVGYGGGAVQLAVQPSDIFDALLTEGLKLPQGTDTIVISNLSADDFDVTPVFALSL